MKRHPWWPAAAICVLVLSLAAIGLITTNPDTPYVFQLTAFICFTGVTALLVLVRIDRDERAERERLDDKRSTSRRWIATHRISRRLKNPKQAHR